MAAKFILATFAIVMGYVFIQAFPDLVRYMRIRSM